VKIKFIFLLPVLLLCSVTFSGAADFNVKDFGAAGDGISLNTGPIQAAIDSCALSGGRVVIPAGTFLTGSLYLRSNVTLWLDPGAVLLGSPRLEDYSLHDPEYPSYADHYVCRSLIYAEGETNIGISGQGTLNGNGGSPSFRTERPEYKSRPYVIRLVSCRDVHISQVCMVRSAMWMQHYQDCERVFIRGIRVYNHSNYNNDGMDIDGCRDVIISGCIIDSSDDGICLKSTGLSPCENISISDCIVSSHVNAFKCGTESIGGFRNITISNCIVKPSADRRVPTLNGYIEGESGIALEIMDGGTMENVLVSGLVIDSVKTFLFIKLGNRGRKHREDADRPGPGTMRNIRISNVSATHASALCSSITGFPDHYAENISLSDIYISCLGGGTKEDLDREPAEDETGYPWPGMFGTQLPAYGLYARHVRGLYMDRIRFELLSPDPRPACHFEDVEDLSTDKPQL
jgi:polygalacturonase